MAMFDDDGQPLDATFYVDDLRSVGQGITVVFESAGGRKDNRRNADYNRGLELVLSRAGSVGATLTRVDVETKETLHLSEDARRLPADGVQFPNRLQRCSDFGELRRRLSALVAEIGRKAKAKGGGNRQKRLRLYLELPRGNKAVATSLGPILAGEPGGSTREYRVPAGAGAQGAADAPRPAVRASGQGRLNDEAKKKAIELYAMRLAADHFSSKAGGSWKTQDVSNESRGYDLHCQRGKRALRVEVKGTTTAGTSVVLTKNEVESASANPHESVLFVVSHIKAKKHGEDWQCSDGKVRILQNWSPREQGELKPTQFEYLLPGKERAT